jgi:hypothetical protein
VPSAKCQVPSAKCQVPSAKCQVPSAKCLLVLVVCWLTISVCFSQGSNQNPLTEVRIRLRDYTGNVPAQDRHIGIHPSIEYDRERGSNVKQVVYVKGSTVTIAVTWENTADSRKTGTLTWQGAQLRCPGPWDAATNTAPDVILPLTLTGTFNINLAPYGTQTVTAVVTGVPSYVAVGALEVKFNMPLVDEDTEQQGNNGTGGLFRPWERLPLVDATPVGLMAVPWADFAEYSCRWAFGFSGASEVRRQTTIGMHYSRRCPWNRLAYDPGTVAWYAPYDYPNTIYVSDFMDDMDDPWLYCGSWVRWSDAYCAGFAGIDYAAKAIHGINAQCTTLQVDPQFTGFYTWPLCPAGTDSTSFYNYFGYGFAWHCVVISSSMRYDSAVSYWWDYNGSNWYNPAFDWPNSVHWQNPVGFYLRGLVFGYNLSFNVQVPCYQQVVISPAQAL